MEANVRKKIVRKMVTQVNRSALSTVQSHLSLFCHADKLSRPHCSFPFFPTACDDKRERKQFGRARLNLICFVAYHYAISIDGAFFAIINICVSVILLLWHL